MSRNDLLQKNVDHMLGQEAKLREEYERLRTEWKELEVNGKNGPTGRDCPPASGQKANTQAAGNDRSLNVYHWLNNLSSILRQVSRLDYYCQLGPRYSVHFSTLDDSSRSTQVAKLFLLLEKKLVTSLEIAQQMNRVRTKVKKPTFTLIVQNAGMVNADEKVRVKLIAEQHFIQNPPVKIQSLIGSYASTIQKELNLKQLLEARPKRHIQKAEELSPEESDFPLGVQTARNNAVLPEVAERSRPSGWATDRTTTKHKPQRKVESDLREYVTSRTRDMRKSGSTEGLADFLQDLQLRKRDLANFIEKHKRHKRGATVCDTPLESSHKRTVSSLTSTCPSVGKADRK